MAKLAQLSTDKQYEWNDEIDTKFNKIFDLIDTDKNGKLTFDEVKDRILTGVLRQMGQNPTDSEIKEYLGGIDKDGDGEVSKGEFKEWIQELLSILQDPQKSLDLALQIMFKACDLDGNGKLSRQEFSKFLREKGFPLHNDEVRELFTAVDNDGDVTSLNKEELLNVMQMGRIDTTPQ